MTETALALVAVICAIPYWLAILLLLYKNRQRASAWLIAGLAALFWPALFFCSILQLSFVIPMFVVYFEQGLDLSQGLATKTALRAGALTGAFFLILGGFALWGG